MGGVSLVLLAALSFTTLVASPILLDSSAIAARANVVWTSPRWKDDGSGAMPLGNGDVSLLAWVSDVTGDLRLVVGKSDAFDENSQPVKVGILRLRFDPPLWATLPPPPPHPPPAPVPPSPPTPAPAPTPLPVPCAAHRKNYTLFPHLIPQDRKNFTRWLRRSSVSACEEKCTTDNGCCGFTVTTDGPSTTTPNATIDCFLYGSVGALIADGTPGFRLSPRCACPMVAPLPPPPPSPPPLPPPPSPAPPAIPGQHFMQLLDLPTGTMTIETANYTVKVHVDANVDIVRVVAITKSASAFHLSAILEPYRRDGWSNLGRECNYPGDCKRRLEHADTILSKQNLEASPSLRQGVVWFHFNHLNTTYTNETMIAQGMDPGKHADPFTHRIFGGAMLGSAGLKRSADGLRLDTANAKVSQATLEVSLLTQYPVMQPLREWLPAMEEFVSNYSGTRSPSRRQVMTKAHNMTWRALWNRSFVYAQPMGGWQEGQQSLAAAARNISDHISWNRYLALIQGRRAFTPTKWNGGDFKANVTGHGFDWRQWGADWWWQNTREPYYNCLAMGDRDMLHKFFDFYLRMLNDTQARTVAQFQGTPHPLTAGALYGEVTTLFGTYNPGDWGCNSPVPKPDGASNNAFIRFHWTGSLELSLMILDSFDFSGDHSEAKRFLPICFAVVEGFRQRFPNIDPHTGLTDMFPAQALETWQCWNVSNRDECTTNPTPDVAGLHAVLSRLIALPPELRTEVQIRAWTSQLRRLPSVTLGLGRANHTVIKPALRHMAQNHNAENVELYSVHPFRLAGLSSTTANQSGLANLSAAERMSIAQQTYHERQFHMVDTGWGQAIMDAAMLNLSADAAAQVASRASVAQAIGYRFRGFSQAYEDVAPSMDHFAFFRLAVNLMILMPVDDAARSMLLFPTWPSYWDVKVKLHGPRNTVVEASCTGGKLDYLVVTPAERARDVVLVGCRGS